MSLLVVAALVMPLVVGLAWRRLLGVASTAWPFALADAWLLGTGWIGASLVAATVAGAPLTLAVAWPLAALPVLAAPFRRRATIAPTRPPERMALGERIAIGIVGAIVAVTAVHGLLHGLAIPIISHDGFAIWGLKSVTFFEAGGIDPAFFTVDRDAPMHPDYPLVQPMFGAWLLANAGVADERLLKAPGAILWLCLVATLYRAGRARFRATVALVFAAAVGLVDFVLQAATLVNADLLFTALVVRGAIDDRRSGRIDAVAIACLALAPSVKNEGWAAIVAVGLARLATSPGGVRAGLRTMAWTVGAALAIAAPWIVFKMQHGLYNDLWHGAWVFGHDPAGDPTGVERLLTIARTTFALPDLALFDRAWLVVAVGALPILLALRAPDVRRFTCAASLLAFAYGTALFATPHNLVWHVSTAAPRLLGHVLPLALLAVWMAAGHFLALGAPRIIRQALRDEEER